MNLFSLLLRLVLCACLVANGAGAAQASVRMAFEQATAAVDAATGQGRAPCQHDAMPDGGHVNHALAVNVDHGAGVAPSATSHDMTYGDTDHCNGKSGACTCVQQATCAMMLAILSTTAAATAPPPSTPAFAHPQPRLPHLIRPPIG